MISQKEIDAYTLYYLKPLLVSRNPFQFEMEREEHHFIAKDTRDATEHADCFLMQGLVSCNHVERGRVGIRLDKDFPHKVIKDHFPTARLDRTG